MLNLTKTEIDALWEEGFRPYEIYIYNGSAVEYCGERREAGTIGGWEIKHIFSTRESLKTYPHFDEVIGLSYVGICNEVWKG